MFTTQDSRNPGARRPVSQLRASPFTMHRRKVLGRKVLFKVCLYPKESMQEGETVRLAILKADLIRAKERGMWETVKKRMWGLF